MKQGHLQLSDYRWASPTREPWMADAVCAQTDPDLFFPEAGGSSKAAKKLCAECPVRAQCLAYALKNGETEGIWGGASPKERRAMRSDAA